MQGKTQNLYKVNDYGHALNILRHRKEGIMRRFLSVKQEKDEIERKISFLESKESGRQHKAGIIF